MRIRALVAACCLLAAACGGAAAGAGPATPAASAPASGGGNLPPGTVTVFAAASLTDAFDAIADVFEGQHPGVEVRANYASSSTLATQITQGAPADVFASANGTQMAVVADAGLLAADPVDFAGNTLTIAVEPGNPLDITGLADLARDDVTVVLAADEVPAGEYAREALDRAGLDVRPASLETDVRAVLTRVSLGEADAGIVYTSDIAAAGDRVASVAIPADRNVPATYPIAALGDAAEPAAAQAFVDLVTSRTGRDALRDAGFQRAP